jgi:hypothetical protein
LLFHILHGGPEIPEAIVGEIENAKREHKQAEQGGRKKAELMAHAPKVVRDLRQD